jgi:hypothetical protein
LEELAGVAPVREESGNSLWIQWRWLNFTLKFTAATGTELMVVNNTGLGFISGTFNNLTNGQAVALSYDGTIYNFVANYYGGSGNDLLLVWASNRAFAWGLNSQNQLGDNTTTNRLLPVPVKAAGVLAGKTLVAIAAGTRIRASRRSTARR